MGKRLTFFHLNLVQQESWNIYLVILSNPFLLWYCSRKEIYNFYVFRFPSTLLFSRLFQNLNNFSITLCIINNLLRLQCNSKWETIVYDYGTFAKISVIKKLVNFFFLWIKSVLWFCCCFIFQNSGAEILEMKCEWHKFNHKFENAAEWPQPWHERAHSKSYSNDGRASRSLCSVEFRIHRWLRH